jgi:hypothetical protein
MFFTPERVLGLVVLVAIVIAIGFLLKRLDAALGPQAAETEGDVATLSVHSADHAAAKAEAQASHGKPKR